MHDDEALGSAVGRVVSRQERWPGLVIGTLAGERQHVRAFGEADADTLFEIGSITKPFTALALAALHLAGRARTEEPLSALLPPSVRIPTRDGREMTLVHLASHTSGLPRMPPGLPSIPVGEKRRQRIHDFSVDDLWAALGRTRLACRPGERYRYSNFGASVLGHALARRAGVDYEELLRAYVSGPLGLSDTVISPSTAQRARVAAGHSWRGRPVPPWSEPALAPAGSLRSTANDMLRFVRANLGAAPAQLREAVRLTHATTVEPSARLKVGLGWHMTPLVSSRLAAILPSRRRQRPWMVWHNGGTWGFRSFVGFVPGAQTGVVVLGNRFRSVDALAIRILDAITPE